MERVINFRYKPLHQAFQFPTDPCKQAVIQTPPRVFAMFDTIVWFFQGKGPQAGVQVLKHTSSNDETVLIYAQYATMAKAASLLTPLTPGQRRHVVFAGEDNRASGLFKPPAVAQWESLATSVWYEALDIAHPFLRAIPMGLNYKYVLLAGVETTNRVSEQVDFLHPSSSSSPIHRQLVCAAWGGIYSYLDNVLPSRKRLIAFLQQQSWVQRVQWPITEYWERTATYHYMLCPLGNGIQSPKIFENLYMGTIPIMERVPATESLVALGFPLLLVNDWEELSEKRLIDEYLSRYQYVDWVRVRQMLRPENILRLVRHGNYSFLAS